MNLLAIDTSWEACSVGVVSADRTPIFHSEIIGRGHAERLLPMIETAMSEAGVAFADLDRIAVTVGPGSFTGVRIGIAAARGFALVNGCEVVGIGTLAVLAAHARSMAGAVPVLASFDARRGEVYAQLFAADGTPVNAPRVGAASDFADLVGSDTVLAGSGAELIAAALSPNPSRVVHHDKAPDIGTLVSLGLTAKPDGAMPRPLYLRPPDAKPQAAASLARQ